jgi:A/G-specific adenine glycosylase
MAYSNNTIGKFPVKSKTIKLRTRYFNYLVIQQNNLTFVKKREDKDIWGKLYEYPLIETTSKVDKGQLKTLVKSNSVFSGSVNYSINKPVLLDAQLTHQKIRASFWEITVTQGNLQYEKLGFQPIKNSKMSDYPIHRLIERYLLTKKTPAS